MTLFWLVFSVYVGAIALIVLLSYAIALYEAASTDPQLVEHRFAPGQIWLAIKLMAAETAFLALTVVLHPLGWIPFKEQPRPENRETPIILLHGLFHNRACWLWMKFRLRRKGFPNLITINLPPWKNVETLTERVVTKVDELRVKEGFERVHLVGHSMGGIIARNYVQIRGGASKVESCILLGAPNLGSKLAPFAVSQLGRQLMPGSEFLKRLAQTPLPAGVSMVSIFTRHDNMVLPPTNARLEGAINEEIQGMGHTSLLYHPRAIHAVVETLSRKKIP